MHGANLSSHCGPHVELFKKQQDHTQSLRSASCTLKPLARPAFSAFARGDFIVGSHSKNSWRRAASTAGDLRQTDQSNRSNYRDARLHFVLASVRSRPVRPRIVSILHRRHRRDGMRPLGAVFHSRSHDLLVRIHPFRLFRFLIFEFVVGSIPKSFRRARECGGYRRRKCC